MPPEIFRGHFCQKLADKRWFFFDGCRKVLIDKIHKKEYYNGIFLDSSMVEHSAVNRVVAGSSPARGVSEYLVEVPQTLCFVCGCLHCICQSSGGFRLAFEEVFSDEIGFNGLFENLWEEKFSRGSFFCGRCTGPLSVVLFKNEGNRFGI